MSHVSEAFYNVLLLAAEEVGMHRWCPSLTERVRVRLQRGSREPVGRGGPAGGGGAGTLSRLTVLLGEDCREGDIAVEQEHICTASHIGTSPALQEHAEAAVPRPLPPPYS